MVATSRASAPTVRVEGATMLRATMKQAADDLGTMNDVHQAIAGYVASRAASMAPKVSGKLAGSVRGNRAASSAIIRVGRASVPYAGPIHYGWPAHNITANPFAVTAAHITEPIWTRWYVTKVESILAR